MAIVIRGKNMAVTDALKEYIEQKIGRIATYFDPPSEPAIHVTLTVIREQHIVEVNAAIEGQLIRAQATSEDMYASIDLAEEKLGRQIRKYKTRVHRKDRKRLAKEDTDFNSTMLEEEEIVRIKTFHFKPMDTEEAILQMNLLGHKFFVYRDEVTSHINVLYKRYDGKYGRIITE